MAVRLGSEARGRRSVTGGKVKVKFTCTGQEAILLKPCTETHAGDADFSVSAASLGVSKKLLDTAYCYKPGLREVPEGLPELHVQVLCDAFKLSASQLWIDDVLS